MKSLGINFPFKETSNGGVIGYTQTDSEAIKANLTAFVTLKRGQRVMRSSLYSPIYDYIMEPWDSISEDGLSNDLKEKIKEFFPEIVVNKINFDIDERESLLKILIYYTIVDIKVSDMVSFSVFIEV